MDELEAVDAAPDDMWSCTLAQSYTRARMGGFRDDDGLGLGLGFRDDDDARPPPVAAPPRSTPPVRSES